MPKNNETKDKKQNSNEIKQVVEQAFSPVKKGDITSDVLGSYTGNPLDGEQPVQDADDL